MKYDYAIIGAGIGGLMFAYRIKRLNPSRTVVILEYGKGITKRVCPVITKGIACTKCPSCAVMHGEGGCGAFSDAKFILQSTFGGWLPEYLGSDTTDSYIAKCDDVLKEFGATDHIFYPDDDLKDKCAQYELELVQSKIKHLGTDNNLITMTALVAYLKDAGVEILTEEEVYNVAKNSDNSYVLKSRGVGADKTERTTKASKIILATGRSGGRFIEKLCNQFKIERKSNFVDIGVRVELPRVIWKHFEEKIYDPKIKYITKQYKDRTRSFCFNGGGLVVTENVNGILTVNGHAYAEDSKKTLNSNFSILCSINFTEPFNDPNEYIESICKTSNLIGGGNVLVQRFGDLVKGRRSTEKRMEECTTRPTLKATPGDLGLVIPKRQLDNVIEMIYQLDKVAPGTADDNTLLYGVEAKYYSAKPKFLNDYFMIHENMYCIGDGSGVTRGLAQAGAMGIYLADQLVKE